MTTEERIDTFVGYFESELAKVEAIRKSSLETRRASCHGVKLIHIHRQREIWRQ